MLGQNNKYRDIQAVIRQEMNTQKMTIVDLADESGVAEATIQNFLKYYTVGTTDTICSMMEVLGLVETPERSLLEKIGEAYERGATKYLNPNTVKSWFSKQNENIRWNSYLLLCDGLNVDALEYWGT